MPPTITIGRRLPMASSLEASHNALAVPDALEAMLVEEIPGFQVRPDAGSPLEVASVLEEHLQGVDPEFLFTARASMRSTYDGPVHTDARLSGVALHESVKGEGVVYLAATDTNRAITLASCDGVTIGEWYIGNLTPGILTVFSEGMTVNDRLIGKTLHYFKSAIEKERAWRRYSFAPELLPWMRHMSLYKRMGLHLADNESVSNIDIRTGQYS